MVLPLTKCEVVLVSQLPLLTAGRWLGDERHGAEGRERLGGCGGEGGTGCEVSVVGGGAGEKGEEVSRRQGDNVQQHLKV